MRRTYAKILVLALALGVSMAEAISQGSTSSGGFTELHRVQLAETGSVEIVMGLIERDGESRSGKHHHPRGEFGYVLDGTVVVTTEDGLAETLNAGDSFYQPPGEWHVVSTGAAGTRTVVFRVVETGEPMVIPVE
jgi:quercetin dioxygenase-like cupin family protein